MFVCDRSLEPNNTIIKKQIVIIEYLLFIIYFLFITVIILKKIKKKEEVETSEDLSIAEISYQVGFSSQAYFATVFKSKFGVTPKAFKENKN